MKLLANFCQLLLFWAITTAFGYLFFISHLICFAFFYYYRILTPRSIVFYSKTIIKRNFDPPSSHNSYVQGYFSSLYRKTLCLFLKKQMYMHIQRAKDSSLCEIQRRVPISASNRIQGIWLALGSAVFS